MAVDIFLDIDGIKGESKDGKHKETIDVLSWSWGMSQSGTAHLGGGAGAGKVQVQDLSFTHYIDKASPTLMKHCCDGKHIKKAKLIIRKAGEHPLEYLTVEMQDILVSHVSTGGSHGEDRLTENVTLNFAKFHAEYKEQLANGSAGKGSEVKWDIPANKSA
jgi:type VI secretion system secreted protein Hcp